MIGESRKNARRSLYPQHDEPIKWALIYITTKATTTSNTLRCHTIVFVKRDHLIVMEMEVQSSRSISIKKSHCVEAENEQENDMMDYYYYFL